MGTMSGTTLSDGGKVESRVVPCMGRCNHCGGEFLLRFMTWEGHWAVRVLEHGIVPAFATKTVPCPGGASIPENTLKRGTIK